MREPPLDAVSRETPNWPDVMRLTLGRFAASSLGRRHETSSAFAD
jgi:hypothetical protein